MALTGCLCCPVLTALPCLSLAGFPASSWLAFCLSLPLALPFAACLVCTDLQMVTIHHLCSCHLSVCPQQHILQYLPGSFTYLLLPGKAHGVWQLSSATNTAMHATCL